MANARGRRRTAQDAHAVLAASTDAVGCQNMVLSPYHRARLELMRRSMDRLLGPHSHLAARIDRHDDLVTDERALGHR